MAAEERPSPATAASPPRTRDGRVAVRHLEAALIEQARLGDHFQRSLGTSSEQASFARLNAASQRVSECDQAVKALSDTGRASATVPSDPASNG